MKKFMVMAASAAALVMLGACSNNNCNNCKGDSCGAPGVTPDEKVVYTGILPAADVDQIRYTLTLDFDDDTTAKGDFDLVEAYQNLDSVAVGGVKDVLTVRSEGDFVVMDKDNNKYIKLITDMKDSDAKASPEPVYFLIENDSTLTLVNSDLQKSATELNYSITRTK